MPTHTISAVNGNGEVMYLWTDTVTPTVTPGGGGVIGAQLQMIVWPTNIPPPTCTYVEYVEVENIVINGAFDCAIVVAFASPTGAELIVSGVSTSSDWTLTDIGSSEAWVYTGSKLGPSTTPATLRLTPTDPVGDELLMFMISADSQAAVPASITFDSIVWSWI